MSTTRIWANLVKVLILAAAVSIVVGNPATGAQPRVQVVLDIRAQPLGDVLIEFAHQSGLQILFFTEGVQRIASPGLVGTYSPDAALDHLLKNTALYYEFVDDRSVVIHVRRTPPTPSLKVD